MLPFSSPKKIKEHVLKNCEFFSRIAGSVYNTVHNVQANVPIENIIVMIDGLNEFR
jgi:uroporphyrinogen-III decarboxylase